MKHIEHLNIRVAGRVQGVFFRASAQHVAEGLGLNGSARNNPDGSVIIEVEGDPDALREFVDWCQDGPPKARVEHVDVEKGSLQYYDDFRIID